MPLVERFVFYVVVVVVEVETWTTNTVVRRNHHHQKLGASYGRFKIGLNRETVLEAKELLGPQPLSAVQEAQQEILSVVRELVQSGQIEINRGKDGDLVS